ncbi:MAG: TolC family protein [Synergistaceae bacterium]|nr:TolC family protein [Synergistaceae bacterium]
MKHSLCILFTALLIFSGTATAAEVVTLDRYLEIVKSGNYDLEANIRSIEAAYYGVLASVGYQRPALSAGIGGSYLTGQKASVQGIREKNITSSNLDLVLSWRINLGKSYALDEQQQILSWEIERARFDDSINTLLATAEKTWWTAVLARENIALQKDVLRQRVENNRVTEEKYKQQMVPRLDLIRSEAQVVEAESLVSRAESQYRNLLKTMAGLAGGIDVAPAEEPLTVPELNVTVDIEGAFLSRPAVNIERLTLERNRILKKLTSQGLSPTLNAEISWRPILDPWNSGTPQEGEAVASLRLNIPITDGNETKYRVLNTDRLILAAEATLKSAENATRTELEIALNNWEDAAVLEKDKKRQVERSDEELEITNMIYNEGLGAQIDLINAQTENQRVRTEYLNAVKEMYIALVEIGKTIGDYAPDGDGNWKEAALRYGRGDKIADIVSSPENSPKGTERLPATH